MLTRSDVTIAILRADDQGAGGDVGELVLAGEAGVDGAELDEDEEGDEGGEPAGGAS